ncbi:MAG: hypothetical protein IT581_05110 [Verrucomicrobiales bacterium]|nr:hypothetical protein [Verrucomicrobiales bacterium]
MPWIKKNLTLVLGGLVGLILLGGSAFFLFSEASREGGINAQLEEKRNEWTRLNNLNPFPDEKNIKATKDEAGRVGTISGSLRENIKPVEVPPVTDTFSLRLLVETTISELTKEAEAAGVNLPDRYAFTFQKLRDIGGQFDSNGIPKLAEQVAQISTLSRVMFNAKIHSLDTIRRPPVLKDEGSGSDYLTKKSVTNEWVVRAPYDVSFRCFSSELAAVIRGLAALEQCIVIKTLNVETTTLPQSASPVQSTMIMPAPVAAPEGGSPGPGGMDAALRARYGLGGGGRPGEGGGGLGGDAAMRARYGLGPAGGGGGMDPAMRSRYGLGGGPAVPPPTLAQPVTPGGAPAPSGPSVVLDEKPLRVILQVDFVKPKPAPATPARAARPAPATSPDAAGNAGTPADSATQPAP